MIDPRRILRPRLAPLPLVLAAATLPAPAGAASRPDITLQATADDGTPIPPVDVSDLSVSVSRTIPTPKTPAKADAPDTDTSDDPSDQVNAMLDLSALSNPALLNWIGKGSTKSTVRVTVTGRGREDATYVLTGITTWSLSLNHSSSGGDGQAALTMGAKHLTINGVTVN